VAYVWGKRDLKTAQKLRKRIGRLGISYDRIGTDDRDSFVSAFGEDKHEVGKEHRTSPRYSDSPLSLRSAKGRSNPAGRHPFTGLLRPAICRTLTMAGGNTRNDDSPALI
jgi:hypothetical protein